MTNQYCISNHDSKNPWTNAPQQDDWASIFIKNENGDSIETYHGGPWQAQIMEFVNAHPEIYDGSEDSSDYFEIRDDDGDVVSAWWFDGETKEITAA